MTGGRFVSEAPVACEIIPGDGGTWALERRLDRAFTNLPAARAAFHAEVEAAGAQQGGRPGVAVVFETAGGDEPRLVREYRPEGTLRDLISAGRSIPVEDALGIVSAIAGALDTLHRLGIVHGDPAPENVLLRAEGGIALADARSSRRELGLGPGVAQRTDSRRGDRAVLLPLARRLVRLEGESDACSLRQEALSILDGPWEEERKISALERLAGPARVLLAPIERRPNPQIPFPVPVSISVAAIPDPRARYAAAKICAPAVGLTPARAARLLEAGTLAFDSVFPSPARSLAAVLRAAGAEVSILASARAPAPIRIREE